MRRCLGKLECSGANGSSRDADLRESIMRSLGSQSASVNGEDELITSTANIAENWTENTLKGGNEDKSDGSIAQQELFAIVQQAQMGKGKDKGKGKDNGVWWNCGEIGHYSRDCPSEKR